MAMYRIAGGTLTAFPITVHVRSTYFVAELIADQT